MLALLAAVTVGATLVEALSLTLNSRTWPLIHDAPLMHYVARRILEGAVPYRDLFDMNFPGVYLAHVAVLRLIGPGDGAFRAFDLGLLALVAAGLVAALRPFGGWAGAAGAALFWLYHLAGGVWRTGQRDLMLCVPLVWMVAGLTSFTRSGRVRALAGASLALGVAVWIKPQAVLWLPLLAWLGLTARPRRPALTALAVGLLVPAVSIATWLAWTGAWPAFLDIVRGYLVPLYSRVGRVSPVEAVGGQYLGMPLLLALTAWAAIGALALRRPPLLLVAGVLYGVLHYRIQGKGWEYHLYPLALFLIALGAAGLGAAVRARRALAVLALLVALVVTTRVLGVKGQGGREPDWIVAKMRRVDALTATLAPDVAAGGAVQVLDTTEGGIHALYRLGAREPTRFLYDFHFYHDVDHPYVQRLRAELVAGLAARPPAAVVLFERGWPAGGYERLDGFPALRDWLLSHYMLAVEGDGYRVYRPRPA